MIDTSEFLTYSFIGAAAQLVDGALGMAYGVISTGILIGMGLPPLIASASVHYAETFTIGASGLSHLVAGNVRRQLFWSLTMAGGIGVLVGSQLLVHLPSHWVRLAIIPYLLLIGVALLRRVFNPQIPSATNITRGIKPLGFVAGFFDAIGGGGWSAITVTTLIARGLEPRKVIGSVHLAKCLVSALASISFLLTLDRSRFHGFSGVAGLVVGGVIAAPFGALLVRHLASRITTFLAGLAVLMLSIYNVITLLH